MAVKWYWHTRVGILGFMTSDDPTQRVTKARDALQRHDNRRDRLVADLHTAIVEALRAGVKQVDLVRTTGYTREYLRQIRKAADDAEGASRPPAKS